MFIYLNNNRGIALLTVMAIMAVLVVVGSLVLSMSSSESRVVYDYGNNNRAFYVAEAGADLAIREWKNYIDSLPVVYDEDGYPVVAVDANIGDFLNRLDHKIGLFPTDPGRNVSGNPRYEMEKRIRNSYALDDNSPLVWISYAATPDSGTLAPVAALNLTVTGNYDGGAFEQRVQLYYDSNGNVNSYKGSKEITISKVAVEGVTVSPASLFLVAGGEPGTLTATVLPHDASNKKVTWSSSNTGVAIVDNGVVTPVAAGSATITVRTEDGGFIAECAVTVNPSIIPAESVTLDKHNLTMTTNVGSYLLTAAVAPEQATVSWTSSNPPVAEVSNTGWVTAKSVVGTAVITLASVANPDIKDTCTVNVVAPNYVPPGGTYPGPAVLANLIDTTVIIATDDLYVTGYVIVKNNGVLNVGSADVLSVGTNFTAENNSTTTINDVQNIAIGQNFTVLNNADTTISNVQNFTIGSDMNLSNNGPVDFNNVNTIRIGGDFNLDNNSEVNFNNVDILIIESDFTIANNTTVTFRNTPTVIIKGNLIFYNNSVLRIAQGDTVITLHGTYNSTSHFQVASGATLTIYDESTPPVLLFKKP